MRTDAIDPEGPSDGNGEPGTHARGVHPGWTQGGAQRSESADKRRIEVISVSKLDAHLREPAGHRPAAGLASRTSGFAVDRALIDA